MNNTLFSFGHGYSVSALVRTLSPDWDLIGTTRDAANIAQIAAQNTTARLWPGDDISTDLACTTHLLISTAPNADGDPVFAQFGPNIKTMCPNLRWVGYLSTTGVYGDHGGDWVDENTPLSPATIRGKHRVLAEQKWRACDLPLHIFRLAGIYGPGRGPFAKVRNKTARRIIKSNQVFSRTHVDDIAQVIAASMARPNPGAIYNVCDDDPAAPQDVIAHAATLLGMPVPPAIDFETADLSPMARSFYAESKRVRNDRIKDELGVKLLYPTYRDGLAALLKSETIPPC